MSVTLSIHGHAQIRVFTYTENGIHHEFTAPGGAALVAQILSGMGLAKPVTLDSANLKEHLELARFEDKKAKKNWYAVSRRGGVTPGKTCVDSAGGRVSLLWGSDFETLPVEEDTSVLWASNAGLPKKEQFATLAKDCFLLLDADILRFAGAMISRHISWERTAAELIWQMQNNPALSYLLQARHILVTFAEDGAAYIKHGDDGSLTACLVLTHGGGEGTLREKLHGQIDDAFAVMTAAAALQFEDVMTGGKELRVLPVLKSAEALMLSGYDINRLNSCEFNIFDAERSDDESAFEIPVKPGQNTIDPDNWCISNSVSNKRIFDIAYDYVREGPQIIDGLPQLSFGALTTVDRWEIEAYQNIRTLIVGYADSNSIRPLSIAVFGSPGSGKSFGVTQIAKNVLPGKVEKLEFNVSQLTGLTDLGAAFQKVRDVILEGKLPLVFFDEFDSDRDGLPLGWIKSFLMPMQDGKFKDESGEHPLGKCILVFAGGTAAGFEEFILPMQSDKPKARQDFVNIKGPDFVSRLRGTINVLGPNPKDREDKNYILRRALLLRSLCERNEQLKEKMKKGGAPISPNILWAMLLVPMYKHGARSMEAILDMSRIDGNVWEPVSLPFYSQLSLHVDADAFIKLVLREVILNSYTEQLAVAIHEDYLQKMLAAGNIDHPSAVAWESLSDEFRESNRDQARSIAKKLHVIGYAYDAGDTPFPSVDAFDDDTVILLAQHEHQRWMKEKFANGWEFAPLEYGFDLAHKAHTAKWDSMGSLDRKNAAINEMRKEKKSHLLCPWESLPDDEAQKDINVAENIIPMLKAIGLRVYKTV